MTDTTMTLTELMEKAGEGDFLGVDWVCSDQAAPVWQSAPAADKRVSQASRKVADRGGRSGPQGTRVRCPLS